MFDWGQNWIMAIWSIPPPQRDACLTCPAANRNAKGARQGRKIGGASTAAGMGFQQGRSHDLAVSHVSDRLAAVVPAGYGDIPESCDGEGTYVRAPCLPFSAFTGIRHPLRACMYGTSMYLLQIIAS